jgi:ribosomal protein S9
VTKPPNNYRKLQRILHAGGYSFGPGDAKAINRCIAESLVAFFEGLNRLRQEEENEKILLRDSDKVLK